MRKGLGIFNQVVIGNPAGGTAGAPRRSAVHFNSVFSGEWSIFDDPQFDSEKIVKALLPVRLWIECGQRKDNMQPDERTTTA